jgi:hypothetical protein
VTYTADRRYFCFKKIVKKTLACYVRNSGRSHREAAQQRIFDRIAKKWGPNQTGLKFADSFEALD